MMKATLLIGMVLLAALLTPRSTSAEEAKDPQTVLMELLGNSHWTWYEGNFDRYSKNNKKLQEYWVELYKDGTARVPWRGQPQQWKLEAPNKLTIADSGPNGDKHIFMMDAEKRTGSTENGQLHIHYEKRANKPPRFK